ncbi:MAG: hypothetical protein HFI46_01630 [Lachnospiraceae bacterium]|jgi:Protein of unknown function (DUF2580).|nr:hypothetical protein [Lachnospiraceae bacterium]
MEKDGMPQAEELLVTPQFLVERSQNLQQLSAKLGTAYNRLQELAESTKGCFAGKSAERFRRKVGNRRQEGEALSGELCRLSERLCTIAGEYARAEEENRNVIDGN